MIARRPLALLATLLCVTPAWADHARDLQAAEQLLAEGANEEAEHAAAALIGELGLANVELAQAHRIRGLALFHLGRREDAEAELRGYLHLEPEARLDPALYPPETIVFFETVRRRYRLVVDRDTLAKRPKRKRQPLLNLLPAAGQFQNGHRAKGFVIAGVGLGLLAANLTTYVMLTSSCSKDLTCDRDASSARRLRIVNLASGVALLALYGYSVIDGFVYYGRAGREQQRVAEVHRPWAIAPMIGWGPEPLGVQAAFSF